MIWNALLGVLFSALTAFLSILPEYSAADVVDFTPLRYLISGAHALNNWISLTALFGVIAFWVTIEAVAGGTRIVVWIYNKIPGKAT